MYLKTLSVLSLAAIASAQQTPNLTAALSSNNDLSSLAKLVSSAPDLASMLSKATNITILAPSNKALSQVTNSSAGSGLMSPGMLQAVLQYHVLNGTYMSSAITDTPAFVPTLLVNNTYANVTGGQVVEAVKQGDNVMFYSGLLNNATVTTADTNFTGGVIHIIDNLLVLPANISSTAAAASLSGVVGALTRAKLVNTLDSAMDVTVFAPNNSAFQAIGSAVSNLSVEDLKSVLEYHVVNGTVGYSSMLMNGSSLMTMGGNNVTITVDNGTVFVNSAKVVVPNVLVANGVVHVIDNVLNPNATMAMPDPTASTQMPAFTGATSSSDVPLTSGVPTATSSIGMGPTGAAGGGSNTASSSSSSSGAAMPMRTGAVGAAALFAGAGMAWNM